jgi:TonB-dependent receptor
MNYKKPLFYILTSGILSISLQTLADSDANKVAKEIERITVIGTYSDSLSRAVAIKKESSSIIDIINTEDIGKFPSDNAAEALKLIPGVQIDRNRGEGLGVSVRGLGPTFQVTQLNGYNIAINENVENSNQNGRQFRYDILPSELISSIEVIKSPSASMTEGALGGIVNINTFKSLQIGNQASTSFELSYSDLPGKIDPKFSTLLNWTNEAKTLGTLFSVSYSKRTIRQDRIFTFGWLRGALTASPDEPSLNEVYAPQRNRPTYEYQERERQSISSTIQWLYNEDHELNINLLWSKFLVDFDEIGMDIELGGVVESADIHNDTLVSGTALNSALQLSRESSKSAHNSLTLSFEDKWNIENWTINTAISFSSAYSDTIDPIRRTRLRLSNLAVGFDYSRGFSTAPDFRFPIAIENSANFPGRRIEYRTIEVNDSDNNFTIDVKRYYSDILSSLQFGIQMRERKRTYSRRDIRVSEGINGVYFNDNYFENFPVSDFSSESQGNYPRTFAVASGDTFHQEFFTDSLLESPITSSDKLNSYQVKEQIIAGYIQANFDSIYTFPIFGNFGLRAVSTKQNPSGTSVIDKLSVPVNPTNSYTEILPSVNFNVEIFEDLLLRTAFSKALSRPSLPDLRPGITISTDAPTAKGGNPLLNPYTAYQYDLSLEWYFDQSSYVSASVFLKDITSFISTQAQLVNINNIDLTLSAPFNTGKGSIKGIEASYQYLFSSLKYPFDGLGLQTNYTYVDSSIEITENNLTKKQDIAGLSKHSFNIVAFYELDNFAFRVGYNWRDSFLISNGVGVVADENQNDFGTVDVNISYALTPQISLSFEAVNITNESIKTYFENTSRGGRIDHYGRRFYLGTSIKF